MLLVRRYTALICALLLVLSYANAQVTEEVKPWYAVSASSTTKELYVYYENDKAWPRWNYGNNREAYQMLTQIVRHLSSDSSNVRTIVIEGAASPVGGENYNRALAMRRALILRNIVAKMKGGDKLRIHVISAGEDWVTFEKIITERYFEPNREMVLDIVRSKVSNSKKEHRLKQLDRGETWKLLVEDYMAAARNAAVIRVVECTDLSRLVRFNFDCVVTPIKHNDLAVAQIPKPLTSILPADCVVEELRRPVFAFRSNLLVPTLNIGMEVPIGTHWSIGADYYFPWVWPKRDNKNCFELLAWGVEGRYWFGRNRTVFDRLQGHSLGLYGYMGYYDFERNYHGHQGEFVNVGIDYTYAMAVGKRKQVHFEFSLGVGYIYSQARKYTVIEEYGPLISDKITKKVGFFGPTKANISLVVPIFQKVKPNDRQRGDE